MRLRRLAELVALALLPVWLLWTALALHYSNLPWPAVRTPCRSFAAGVVLALVLRPRRGRTAVLGTAACAVVLGWWLTIAPSHDRDWGAPGGAPAAGGVRRPTASPSTTCAPSPTAARTSSPRTTRTASTTSPSCRRWTCSCRTGTATAGSRT